MKEIKNILLLSFVLLLFSSCEELFNTRSGQEIRFSVSSGNDIMTRTSYSGETAGNKERIDWVTGDEVAVYLYLNNAPGYTFSNTFSDYIVKLSGQEGYISKGTLASKYVDGDGNSLTTLKWVGDDVNQVGHRFYSVYPADYSGSLNEVEVDGGKKIKVDFTGLANQANDQIMNYAYMAAAAPKVYYAKDNEKVDLNYYPMVTTIYVKLVNESTETLSPTVKIKAKEGTTPLAGPFSVWLNGDGNFTPEIVLPDSESDSNLGFVQELERTVSVAGKTEDPGTAEAIFFLLPTDYSGENITLSLSGGKNTSEWNLKTDVKWNTLTAFHKYNLTIKIDKDKEVTIVPPPIDDDAFAQMILSYIRAFDGCEKFYQKFKDFVDNNYTSYDELLTDWNKGFYQDAVAGSSNKLKDFLGDKLDAFFEALAEVEEFKISTYAPKASTLDSTFFMFFKNLKKIDIICETEVTINISSIKTLKEINFTGNGAKHVKINNCESLTTVNVKKAKEFTVSNCNALTTTTFEDNGELTKFYLINTPNFGGASIVGIEKQVNWYLEDCSTNCNSNVELYFKGNGNLVKDGKIRSDKVTVVREDYGGNKSSW